MESKAWIGIIISAILAFILFKGLRLFDKRRKKAGLILNKTSAGVLQLLGAVALFIWTSMHSQSHILTTWVLKNEYYFLLIFASVVFGLLGGGNILLGILRSGSAKDRES